MRRMLKKSHTAILLAAICVATGSAKAQDNGLNAAQPDSVLTHIVRADTQANDTTSILGTDTLPVAKFDTSIGYDDWQERDVAFNPNPTRAIWMSALFPGLGQLYNRRYWKLPIVVGAYLGLGYATSWNNTMLTDYQRAYLDIMDNDPNTASYMNFFPPTTTEASIDKEWLKRMLKSRKDFYRRNRDLCIICMVGVYFLAMVDAYVDASLSHFDISPDLSMNWSPSVIPDTRGNRPGLGVSFALNF